jgi:hypothetical protein
LKIVSENIPFNKNLFIHDFSLHKMGPKEDKAYSKDPFRRVNIRRGNSICQDTEKGNLY